VKSGSEIEPRERVTEVVADLNMLVATGGRERTAAELATMLEGTGWRLEHVAQTDSPLGVVGGRAA
jgi:O-methyltransferase domain